jgi:hypothetical protein
MLSRNEMEFDHDDSSARSVKRSANCAGFDYSALSSSAANFLRGQAHRIRRQSATSVVNIGKDLIGAKHYLSHGAFLKWVELELGLPARTAQAYMQVAQWASRKSASVAHLAPSLLYLLSARSTPSSYVDDVLKRIEAGERIALPDVRADLRDLRQNHRRNSAKRDVLEQDFKPEQRSLSIPNEVEAKLALQRVVSILKRGLSAEDFAQVSEIMTSTVVLDNFELANEIASAFSNSLETHEWKSAECFGNPLYLQKPLETAYAGDRNTVGLGAEPAHQLDLSYGSSVIQE